MVRAEVYSMLQAQSGKGGATISQVVERTGFAEEDIELLLTNNMLGTSASLLKRPCKTCGTEIRYTAENGYTCRVCTAEMAQKGGVSIKPLKELQKERTQPSVAGTLSSTNTRGMGLRFRKSGRGQALAEYLIGAAIIFSLTLAGWQAFNPGTTIPNYLQNLLNATGGGTLVVQPLGS